MWTYRPDMQNILLSSLSKPFLCSKPLSQISVHSTPFGRERTHFLPHCRLVGPAFSSSASEGGPMAGTSIFARTAQPQLVLVQLALTMDHFQNHLPNPI